MSIVARGLILPIVDWTRANGYACLGLFDGLGVAESELRGPIRRLSWADYIEVHERLARTVGGVARLVELVESVPTPTIDWFLGSLDSAEKLYRAWSHISPILWTNLHFDVTDAGDGRLRLALAVPDEAPDASVWFAVVEGFAAGLPRRIGLPRAALEVVRRGPRAEEWLIRPGESAAPPRKVAPGAYELVAEVTEDYGAALKELHTLRRRAAEPSRDLDSRVADATAAWVLTRAQAHVLRGVVRGLSNKEIAAELGNAEATIEVHVTRLLRKAGASGRTALVTRFWGGPS